MEQEQELDSFIAFDSCELQDIFDNSLGLEDGLISI